MLNSIINTSHNLLRMHFFYRKPNFLNQHGKVHTCIIQILAPKTAFLKSKTQLRNANQFYIIKQKTSDKR